MVNFWLEGLPVGRDCLADMQGLVSVLVQLVFVWNQVWQVDFFLLNLDLGAYCWTKLLGEISEFDETVLVGVEEILHNCCNFGL